jgi:hypothetical protein
MGNPSSQASFEKLFDILKWVALNLIRLISLVV